MGVVVWLRCALAVVNDGQYDKEKSAGIEDEGFDRVLCALFHGFTASRLNILRSAIVLRSALLFPVLPG